MLKENELPINQIIHADCLDILKTFPSNSIDLVLTDPPYGINADKAAAKNKGKWGWIYYGESDWDYGRPKNEAFSEIRRISKNQIIWGGNYIADLLPATMGWLVWDKGQREFSLADAELAWTSYNRALRVFNYSRAEALREGKEHPTQKPIDLFIWCLNWAKIPENAIVLDPYSGSGTTAIACYKKRLRFICIEKEEKYVELSQKRLREEQAQMRLNL